MLGLLVVFLTRNRKSRRRALALCDFMSSSCCLPRAMTTSLADCGFWGKYSQTTGPDALKRLLMMVFLSKNGGFGHVPQEALLSR